jgi:hypothetical protein
VYFRRVSVPPPGAFARASLEADRTHKLYSEARRSRDDAEKQMKARSVDWKSGRTTADRYLHAIERWTALVADEHHHLALYNSAIAFVNERRQTLLDEHDVILLNPARCETSSESPETYQDQIAVRLTEETFP